MLKKIFKDFGIYGLAPFIPRIATIFILPLITPYLTKEDYGVFGIIISYVTLARSFYSLGIHVNFTNSFYKSKMQYKWLWRQLYGFWILWSIIYVLILFVLLYFIIPDSAKGNSYLIIFLNIVPIVFLGPASEIGKYYYQLIRMPLQVMSRSVIFGFVSIFTTLYFIKYLHMGYMGWFWSMFITSVLTNISWWYSLNISQKITPIFNFKKKTVLNALRVGLPIIPHSNALLLLNQADRVVMDIVKVDTKEIGLYNVAYSLSNIFDTFGFAYSQAITPYVTELINKKEQKTLRDLIFFNQILFFIAALLFSLVAKEIMQTLILNKSLNTVYPLMVLLVMSMIFKPMYTITSTMVLYHERTKSLGLYSFIAGMINVVACVVFIPYFGIEAAAIATIIGFAFLSFSRFWSKDFKEFSTENYYPILWLILSIITCFTGYYICNLDLKIKAIIFIFLFIIALFIIKKAVEILDFSKV